MYSQVSHIMSSMIRLFCNPHILYGNHLYTKYNKVPHKSTCFIYPIKSRGNQSLRLKDTMWNNASAVKSLLPVCETLCVADDQFSNQAPAAESVVASFNQGLELPAFKSSVGLPCMSECPVRHDQKLNARCSAAVCFNCFVVFLQEVVR